LKIACNKPHDKGNGTHARIRGQASFRIARGFRRGGRRARPGPLARCIRKGRGMNPGGDLFDAVGFDFSRLGEREKYKLLIGAVVPRPIAWVTTVDKAGRVNAAPFSFFNCLSAEPAILALGVEYRPTGFSKDTGRNIRDTQAFT